MNSRTDFGQKIVEARTIRRMTQAELAEGVGISQSHLSRIETGRYSAGLDILNKIADVLGMELDFVEVKK